VWTLFDYFMRVSMPETKRSHRIGIQDADPRKRGSEGVVCSTTVTALSMTGDTGKIKYGRHRQFAGTARDTGSLGLTLANFDVNITH
jgi:hypothetical protein